MSKMRHIYSVNQKQISREIDGYIHIIDYYKPDDIVFVRSRIYKDDVYLGFIRYDYGSYSSQLIEDADYQTVFTQFQSLFLIINQIN